MPTSTLADRLAWVPKRWVREGRYLVAVSGGLDSTALLHFLVNELFYRNLCVVHLDHGLRGDESTADALFVEECAKEHELDYVGGKVNVSALAEELSLSVETAAREARHAFFGQVAASQKANGVFVAHHADDQAETILMQILRGAGNALGMTEETQISDFAMLRPLLSVLRDELREYAESEKLKWREDSSNTDSSFTRNRVRHELLPLARDILGRDVEGPIVRGAQVRRAEEDFLELWTDRAFGEAVTEGGLSVDAIDPLPLAIQRRVVRRWLAGEGVPELGFELIEQVRSLLPCTGMENAKINLPRGQFCRRKAGLLFLDGSSG